MPIPPTINQKLLERQKRVCVVCHQYAYSRQNRMRQIVSNYTAFKLAQGYAHLFKKPIGKSLLDAYIHDACFRRLHSRYRYHTSLKFQPANYSQYVHRTVYSPHDTRGRSSLHQLVGSKPSLPNPTEEVSGDLSIEELLSTPFSTSIATHSPSVELSARSCLFRPCMPRVSALEQRSRAWLISIFVL